MTAEPKAVMIAHDNVMSLANMTMADWHDSFDGTPLRIISYLPLSHIAGMLVDMVLPLAQVCTFNSPATLYFAQVSQFGVKLAS